MKKAIPFLFIISGLSAQTPRLALPIGHSGELTAVAFSPTDGGKYILTGSADNSAKLWDRSGHEIQTFNGHEFAVSSVAFSSDGQRILTGSFDGKVNLWNLSGGLSKTFSGHKDYVNAVAFSPVEPVSGARKHILTGSKDKTAKLWDLETGKETRTFQHVQAVTTASFSPDGKSILTGSSDGRVALWNAASGAKVRDFPAHTGSVKALSFSADGKFILTSGEDKTVKTWAPEGRLLKTLKHTAEISASVFSPDGKKIATGGTWSGKVTIWDAQSGAAERSFTAHSGGIKSLAFSPDGTSILTGSEDKTAKIWDVSGQLLSILKGHTNTVAALTFTSDSTGNFLFTGSPDGTTQKWDISNSDLQVFQSNKQQAALVAIAPDGQFRLTAGTGKVIERRGWSGEILQTYTAASNVTALSFSTDGKFVSAGSDQNTVHVWDLSGKSLYTFAVSAQINAIALSPDGKFVVTGSRNGSFKCWDMTGSEIQNFETSDIMEVLSAAFSPATSARDKKFVLHGSANGTAKLWNLESGKEIRAFNTQAGGVNAAVFTPDGKFIATAHNNGAIKLWSPDSRQELATLLPLDSSDWIVSTPDGLFDASPGAMKRMYYVQGLEVIEFEQLKKVYFEPGLLARLMGFVEGRLRQVQDLDDQSLALYPQVLNAVIEGDKIKVRLQQRSGGIGNVSVLLDGNIELIANANPQYLESFEVDLSPYAGYFDTGRPNGLSLVFYTRNGRLQSPPFQLQYIPGVQSKGDKNETSVPQTVSLNEKSDDALSNTLYALVVGASDYAGDQIDLHFAARDAAAYKEMLELSGAGLFGTRINIKLLTTAEGGMKPTRAAIQAALLDFAAKAEPKDVLLVYLSGHGTTWPANSPDGQFYYLTSDNSSFDFEDVDNRRHAIAQDSLQTWIRKVKARKRILILDACNSGEVVRQFDGNAKGNLSSDQRRALERMKDRSGFFVLAGSAADKSSYEDPRFGHGLLTYSLLRNMPKVAAGDKNHYVDVGKLFMEVREDVPKLASELKKVQEPKLIGMEDFPIGIIKDASAMKLPSAKKIITRAAFSNKKRLDPLKLTDAINDELEKMLAVPTLPFAFWPVDKAAGLYYFLNGEYEVSGSTVKITAYFYKSDHEDEQKTFTVSGSTNQLKNLVDDLMGQFVEYLEGMK